MKKIQIICVAGARPNFVKMAPILSALRRCPRFAVILIHTGQHASPELSTRFFDDLEILQPDINLGIGAGTQTFQTAVVMQKLEPIFAERRPDVVLVVGDVTSTLGAALVASKLSIPIAHVEAGLRSFDRGMPEEINRVLTDALADYLFVSEPSGIKNLAAEGISPDKIFFVGNVMIDTLMRFREKARDSKVLDALGLEPGTYGVLTLHRPSNVDDPVRLRSLVDVVESLSKKIPIVFPVHPRTREKLDRFDFPKNGVTYTSPLGYLDFLNLVSQSRMVLTDSGGIQEETTILGVPCLTMRENTERPITVEKGTNYLVGIEPAEIHRAATQVLDGKARTASVPELWDGKAAERIATVLERLC
jgi:UDP-N-acetylglucosamine 2-epimerase (non-hydrolysing)